MKLASSAFAGGQPIPREYTADGKDISPPLSWSDVPPGTAEFVLIVDDPDAPAGTWDHWLLYGIPGEATSLPEGTGRKGARAEGFLEGKNSWADADWGGPSPPRGPAHHYHFKLYALGRKLNLEPGLTKAELLQAIKGHELGQAELVGTYGR